MLRAFLASFARQQDGAATILMLYGIGIMLMVGGIMLDFANRHRVESILQSAADVSAASAAIRLSEPISLDTPEAQARRTTAFSLGGTTLADAWHEQSFELGHYNAETKSFQPGSQDANAVRVKLSRSPSTGNGERTFLLSMLGISEWDIRVSSIARIRTHEGLPCVDPLLSLKAGLQVGSGRLFAGICLYASAQIDYGGVPGWVTDDTADFVNALLLDVLPQPTSLIQNVSLLGGEPDYMDGPSLRSALNGLIHSTTRLVGDALTDEAQLATGGRFHVSCPSNGVLVLDGPLDLTNTVLISDCPIRIDGDVSIQAGLVISNLLGVLPRGNSIAVPSDAVLERTTSCPPGEGAKIYLFADASIRLAVPALADPDSPLGGFLDDTVGVVGDTVNETINLVGGLLDVVDEVASQTLDLPGLAGLCIGMDTMLSTDRVSLH